MRKTLSGLIALLTVCAMLFCGCNSRNGNAEIENTAENQTEPQATETPTETHTDDTTVDYWEVTCRTIKSYAEKHFAISENSECDLVLEMPADWNLVNEDDEYIIFRDGADIGKICADSLTERDWTVLNTYTKSIGTALKVNKNIESCGSGGDVKYRYRFEYGFDENDEERVISLVVNYEELDANAADKLYYKPAMAVQSVVDEGSLSELSEGQILILGNSFIGTSNIGYILNEMLILNGKDLYANAISRGYAHVSTYTADENIMNEIRSGQYDGVFICGFYNDAESDSLVVLENACNQSNTTLVIFPAHNEFETPINLAQQKCPDLPILNWKAEIDMLIDSGVDKWDMCRNDQHLHSTEYAGLVGAHMIYRSIYGEIPNTDRLDSVDMSHANEIFGSYLETGKVETDYDINYFS